MNQVALYSLTLWYGLKSKLTYRLSSVFELLGKFLEVFAQILIWVALLGSGARFDTTLSQMVTYLILTRVVSTLFATQAGNEIRDKINDGSIANDFVRPLNFKLYLLCNDLGNNFFKVLVVFLPIGVLAGLRYGFLLPQTAAQGGRVSCLARVRRAADVLLQLYPGPSVLLAHQEPLSALALPQRGADLFRPVLPHLALPRVAERHHRVSALPLLHL